MDTLPGEQGQVDWASFGTIRVGRAERKLSCFVMVLSFSRALFARFAFDQTLESFLRGHVRAFEAAIGDCELARIGRPSSWPSGDLHDAMPSSQRYPSRPHLPTWAPLLAFEHRVTAERVRHGEGPTVGFPRSSTALDGPVASVR